MKIFHAHTPDAFLRVLPRLLGDAPRRCILLVAFAEGHTCGLLRFDLPRRSGQTDVYDGAFGLLGAAARSPSAASGDPGEAEHRHLTEAEHRNLTEAERGPGDPVSAKTGSNDTPEVEPGPPAESTGSADSSGSADPEQEWARALDNRARAMIGVFCRIPHADSILPVVYTDRSIGRIRAASSLPWRDFVGEVLTHAEIAGYTVRDALVVSGAHWGHYLAAPGTRAVQRLGLPTEASPDG
ncbi:hypothetical protein D9V34_08550 [Mycetocola lacteus]|uniref:DUF4192 family protein n=1 Tax=Mycetocola lacteus TaxID=76637 RepID=A0A3L7ATF3_9MICO|nr:hypothetical protein [Mycetocola lacteus]RLP83265.1 hypothetical protein D9V34_08550 [Mycetocola lacteus]